MVLLHISCAQQIKDLQYTVMATHGQLCHEEKRGKDKQLAIEMLMEKLNKEECKVTSLQSIVDATRERLEEAEELWKKKQQLEDAMEVAREMLAEKDTRIESLHRELAVWTHGKPPMDQMGEIRRLNPWNGEMESYY